ncbi:hypothetical protein N7530_000814 [Penicillium desertorum]|uniref:Uncharacterized protein n=1 Tax=Penicillium desertorum TaxID=1303715 RepID=A0A9W9X997_9EURO|nr:hypothetical protein N7530_000814 [Penicillium desertorum]
MMLTMIDAVTKTLTLYETALELILGSWSQAQEPNGRGIDRSNNLSSTHNRSSDSSVDTKPTVIVTEVTAYLGRLELGREESAIVAREALRHATMPLGEMLHDIEEDMSTILDPANTRGNGHVGMGEVGQLMPRLIRLLGRISSSYSKPWT